MISLQYAGLILAYSFTSTGSLILIKIAANAISENRWNKGFVIAVAAILVFFPALLFLIMLLQRMPVSVLTPITIGCNLLLTSLAAHAMLKEYFSPSIIMGNILIIVGIVFLFGFA